jgi:hypothetical protein
VRVLAKVKGVYSVLTWQYTEAGEGRQPGSRWRVFYWNTQNGPGQQARIPPFQLVPIIFSAYRI